MNSRKPSTSKGFSAQEIEARRCSVPTITYPNLPVSARRGEIARAIADNQVVIVAGETGSGKTTQLPKICLELGRGITGLIGHTQPRRIAARSVAARICDELGVKLGETIGYQVRFTDETSESTLVKLMTDGILLAEIQSDPLLERYDTLIIDEAHERSLNIDFLLGYIANILPQRPDLKVIITSATIDTESFAAHFGPRMLGGRPGDTAPVIEVSGRTYPVEIRYRPLEREDSEHSGGDGVERVHSIDQVTGILEAADELMSEGGGDILVFLSGEGEIRDTQAAFAEHLGERYVEPGGKSSVPGAVEVLPLFARLNTGEQQRIFAPHSYRRIILATNIAETSLTVPGIRYVIDAGTARISRFSSKTKVQRLPIEPVSQASANQRAGRCGRVADGICIRLYSEDDFEHRDEYTQPEIQRTSLASVILHMLSVGLGDISAFPFIDPPAQRAIRAGIQLLEEIGALDTRPVRGKKSMRLTRIGRQLVRLPIDPRLGRMLLEAERNGCTSEVLVLVAALSVQDVRERPLEFQAQADQLHARFNTTSSDFLAYLNIWRYLRTQQRDLSGSAFRRLCRGEYLNYLRWREWTDVVRQLEYMAKGLGLHIRPLALPSSGHIERAKRESSSTLGASLSSAGAIAACREIGRSADTPSADAIHRSLLVGLLSNLGTYQPRTRDYEGARDTHFVIWPGSGLHRRTPEWVMAAELVETSRLFARTVAAIEGSWIEEAALRLLKRSYSGAYWSSKHGAAMCRERVTLYGMTIAADRPVLLARVGDDSARGIAREMFIEHGLVEGDWRTPHAFLKRNAQALAEAEQSVQRLRQHGLVADARAMANFYDERLPVSITSGADFDLWWKRECAAGRGDSLDFSQEFLVGDVEVSDEDFPEVWRQGDMEFPLRYTFNPDAYGDGVTVEIPVTLLERVDSRDFDWLVPGMFEDLVVSTIRALPKRIRRQLVPAPDVARELRGLLLPYSPWADGTRLTGGEVEAEAIEAPEDKEALTAGLARQRGDQFDALAMAIAQAEPPAPSATKTPDKPDTPPSFREAFTHCVRELRGVSITEEDWDKTQLPDYLCMHFRVLSERGAVLEESTSLELLKRNLRKSSSKATRSVMKEAVAQALALSRHCEEGASRPTKQSIPTQSPTSQSESVNELLIATPAMQTRNDGVSVKVYEQLRLNEERVTSRWSGAQSLALASSPYSSTGALVEDIQLCAARLLCLMCPEKDAQKIAAWGRDRFEDEVYRISRLAAEICTQAGEVKAECKEHSSLALLATLSDIKKHISSLVYEGFLAATPPDRLTDIVRYLRADSVRLAKAEENPSRDDSLAWQLQQVTDMVAQAEREAKDMADDELSARCEQARWLVEELRVSLFAQQLGTREKVSAKRIAKLLNTR